MNSFKYLLETEEVEEENVTGAGEAYSTPFAFGDPDEEDESSLNEARTKSIKRMYKNQSPNRKMNLVLLKAVRCLKESKGYLTQLSGVKKENNMQGTKELWNMSKNATRKAGDLLRDIKNLLREIES